MDDVFPPGIIELENPRKGWVERHLKAHLIPPPAVGRDNFHYPSLLQVPSSLALDTDRDSPQQPQLLWASWSFSSLVVHLWDGWWCSLPQNSRSLKILLSWTNASDVISRRRFELNLWFKISSLGQVKPGWKMHSSSSSLASCYYSIWWNIRVRVYS